MIIIGITGGCGSGKSKIVELIESEIGGYIINADKIGHEVIKKGTKAYYKIIDEFGKEVLDNNLDIDRKILGDIVFEDINKLKILNSISHIEIKKEVQRIVSKINKSKEFEYIIIEAAILKELGFCDMVDYIIYVNCDIDVRVERLKQNRNIDIEKAKNIINNQPTDKDYRSISDYEINNSGAIDITRKELIKIIREIMEAKNEKE